MQIQSTWSDVWLVLPLIVLLVTAIVPITIKVFIGNREQPLYSTLAQGFAGVMIALTAVIWQWDTQTVYGFSQALVFDGLSSWANLLTLIVAGVSLVLMHDNLHTRDHQFSEQTSLLLSSAMGMLIVAWSNDLIISFIGIELMSLSSYVIIGLGLEQKLAKEAAFKYFVLGSFASAFILYGIALIYGTAGSTVITNVAEGSAILMSSSKMFVAGVIMLFAGVAFKISLFPFHAWTPDVYQGAPTPVTAFMATGVKVVMFVFMLRLALAGMFVGLSPVVDVLEWISVLTILLGNLGALRQNNFKRMLAYSSIAHSGYLLLGVIAAGISSTPMKSVTAVLFYLLTYSLMTLGAFGLASLYERTEDAKLTIDELKGLGKRKPLLAFMMTLLLLSVAGIPPLAGFFGKLYLFSTAVAEGLFWPVIWGVIGSVVGVVYYLRPIVNMYMHDSEEGAENPLNYLPTKVALYGSALAMVALGFFSSPVIDRLQETISSLF